MIEEAWRVYSHVVLWFVYQGLDDKVQPQRLQGSDVYTQSRLRPMLNCSSTLIPTMALSNIPEVNNSRPRISPSWATSYHSGLTLVAYATFRRSLVCNTSLYRLSLCYGCQSILWKKHFRLVPAWLLWLNLLLRQANHSTRPLKASSPSSEQSVSSGVISSHLPKSYTTCGR